MIGVAKVVETVIKGGSNVNYVDNNFGKTALHYAAENGSFVNDNLIKLNLFINSHMRYLDHRI